ncbi:MAG: AAA family ATPase [Bacilli bacterium]
MVKNIKWTDFYMEFADKLLEYKDNRTELIQKIQKVYEKININLPTLEKDIGRNTIIPYDIDPFTIFALFNKGITDENRIKIVNGIKEEFSIKSDIPTSFFGIPVVNNLAATFYYFTGNRGEEDIDNLWEVFESALNYSKDFNEDSRKELVNYYNKVIEQKGIKWNITMGLYWIRPNIFINLDAKNRKFLSDGSNVSQDIADEVKILKYGPPVAEKYLQICDLLYSYLQESNEFDNFVELSNYAYFYKEDNKHIGSIKDNDGIGDADVRTIHYWIYSPGSSADKWDEFYDNNIMAIHYTTEIGDLREYSNKEEIRETLQEIYQDDSLHVNIINAFWQFANDIEIGDIIFAKKGMNEIIGRGIVESDYSFNEDSDYPHIRNVKWTHKGSWPYGDENNKLNRKTLTDISHLNEKVKIIESLFDIDEDYAEPRVIYPEYTSEDFLDEVYISEENYYTLEKLLKNKKNLIVQGAPGVGKTFLAKRLAYSIMGVKDVDRVMMVQFHQSYSYEDFVMGYRPSKDGFELRDGSFYKFCKKAEEDDENDYFFIIDEINRGNLSKIFGELFLLIENDKRGEKNKVQLLYADEDFFIPKNVHIIGLMNTADRSLAMIDYALRRRFAFFDLKPGFSSDGFNTYQSNIGYSIFDNIINVMEELNTAIKGDETLGEGFRIGHSYFCNLDQEDDVEEKLNYIVEYEIIPLLKEYWFDEPDKVEEWSEKLRNSLNE